MQATQIAAALEGFSGRGAGTEAERRAATWLASELRGAGRDVAIETFWCRPNWALAHAWHAALALAGSLVSVGSPRVGGALLLAALVFIVLDEIAGFSPGRRLTPERASQNVVSIAGERTGRDPTLRGRPEPRLRLILTANYDAGRSGLIHRDRVRRLFARLRRTAGGAPPGWLGWIAMAIVWLEVIAILRLDGHHGTAVSLAQLLPTVALVLAVALLLELATGEWSPSAGDNGSGVGVLLALARALDTAPPAHLAIDLVLAGAGDAGGAGLRRFLRAHRTRYRPANAALIGLAPCAGGHVMWWRSDGPLIPLHYARETARLANQVAEQASYLGAHPHAGRGRTPALPGRLARIPSIALGCLDGDGLSPRSHLPSDTAEAIEPAAPGDAIQFALFLVDAIDAALAQRQSQPWESVAPTPA